MHFHKYSTHRVANAKRYTGPEEGKDESRGGQRKIRNGVLLKRERVYCKNILFIRYL